MKIKCLLGKHKYKIVDIINEHAVRIECQCCHKKEIVSNPYMGIEKFYV